MTVLLFYKDKLPEPAAYDMSVLTPPLQTPTSREPFTVDIKQQHYVITPKYDYDLRGVVVSYNNASGFTDIWHYDVWKDFLNIRDLCVIWGKNVSSGVYKTMDFSSDTWTCWVSWLDRDASYFFKTTALSNNHLLTDNPQIQAHLLNAEKGDVVHFKGVLAEYKNDAIGFSRGTSVIRTDTGNGACETVYLDEFNIIKKANPFLRKLYTLAKWTMMLSLIGYVICFLRTPVRVE